MKLQHYFASKLSHELLSKLSLLPPRTVIEVLRLSIGKACVRAKKARRIELVMGDFKSFDVIHETERKINSTSNMH